MSKIYKKKGVWYFDEYFNYLEKNVNLIPPDIQDFIVDPDRYLFQDEKTLHDSYLIHFLYKINNRNSKDELLIKLKGSYDNRIFEFSFKNVIKLEFSSSIKNFKKVDMVVHQFHILKNGSFQYEFFFVNGQTIKIVFKDIEIREYFA
ncbi:hypothetical protein RCC89_01610 [Cytophagaceae bacterium ABcell3]|nr:hypothetical protein RCC89_01610 [Cytophagaceae bacterium ABcell3]